MKESLRKIMAIAQNEWRLVAARRSFWIFTFFAPVFVFALSAFFLSQRAPELPFVLVDVFSVAPVLAVLLYSCIFYYALFAIRRVADDKFSRLSEYYLSFLHPAELISGKMLGVFCVALFQLAVVLIFSVGGMLILAQKTSVLLLFSFGDFFGILSVFFGQFLLGYFFFGALLVGVSLAVDMRTELPQYMFFASLCMALSMAVAFMAFPENGGFFPMFFPFSSPMASVLLFPYGISAGTAFGSLAIAVFSDILALCWAQKVYKKRLFYYGKK